MLRKPVILDVQNLTKTFITGLIRTKEIHAVKNVSFQVHKGEVLALVGESGSGKSTISNIILQLIKPTSGRILLEGKDIYSMNKNMYFRNVQVIFQDPFSSFNFYYRVDRVLDQAIKFRYGNISIDEKRNLIKHTLESIRMPPNEILGRFPHQLSGGQMQRFLLARALLIQPKLLIADEPTSMIDACARSGVLNLLKRLSKQEDFTILFITHDIGQAQYLSDNVVVLNQGKIVEQGPTRDVFLRPSQEYTRDLLLSVPSLYRKWY